MSKENNYKASQSFDPFSRKYLNGKKKTNLPQDTISIRIQNGGASRRINVIRCRGFKGISFFLKKKNRRGLPCSFTTQSISIMNRLIVISCFLFKKEIINTSLNNKNAKSFFVYKKKKNLISEDINKDKSDGDEWPIKPKHGIT